MDLVDSLFVIMGLQSDPNSRLLFCLSANKLKNVAMTEGIGLHKLGG